MSNIEQHILYRMTSQHPILIARDIKICYNFHRTWFDLILEYIWRQTNRACGEGVKVDICFGFVTVEVQ